MALESGQDKGGQLVWKMDDDSIVPVRIMIDSDGNLVPIPTGPGATEAKQDDVLTELNNKLDESTFIDQSNLYSNDDLLTIAAGERVLLSRISHINKFGRNPNIDINTDPEDIWDGGGLWVPPTVARLHDIKSSSAEDSGAVISSGTATSGSNTTIVDTSADFVSDGVAVGDTVINDTNLDHSTVISVAVTTLTLHITRHCPGNGSPASGGFDDGDEYRVVNPDETGASIVHVFGLDVNMEIQEEFVIMNGVSNVPTANAYWRIFRMHSDGAADRNTTNVGNITATAQTDNTVTAQISAGEGQTLMAIYTIPAGKTGYMTRLYSSITKTPPTTGAIANMAMYEIPFASIDGAGSREQFFWGLSLAGASYMNNGYKPYKQYLEQTDIIMRCEEVSANGIVISGGYDIILVDNN